MTDKHNHKSALIKFLLVFNTLFTCLLLLATLILLSTNQDFASRTWISAKHLVKTELLKSKIADSIQTAFHDPDTAAADVFPDYQLIIKDSVNRDIHLLAEHMTTQGVMENEDKAWFPATFVAGGANYDVKIRLRGDLSAHWKNPKKSWRIKFQKEKLFEGVKECDLIIPSDLAYEVEMMANNLSRQAGLLTPTARFVKLAINGVNMGPYYFLEKNNKEMIEKQGYQESEIFKEENVWVQTRYNDVGLYVYQYQGGIKNPLGYSTGSFNSDVLKGQFPKSGIIGQRFKNFVDLITKATDAEFERQIPSYLNLGKYYRWNAISWLFGSSHCHWSDNLRWYYDPSTGKFEPILYDVFRWHIMAERKGTFEWDEPDRLCQRLFKIHVHQEARNRVLWTMLNDAQYHLPNASRKLFASLKPELVKGVGAEPLSDLEAYHSKTLEILELNRSKLTDYLKFSRAFISTALDQDENRCNVSFRMTPDSLAQINVESIRFKDAQSRLGALRQISVTDWNGNTKPAHADLKREGEKLIVNCDSLGIWAPRDGSLVPQVVEWIITLGFEVKGEASKPVLIESLAFELRNGVTGELIESKYQFASTPSLLDPSLTYAVAHLESHPDGLPFALQSDDASHVIPPGVYVIDKDTVIANQLPLVIRPGVTFKLDPGASLVIHGEVNVMGTLDAPVKFERNSPNMPWGTFAVIDPSRSCAFSHVHVSGGNEDMINGVFMTGQWCLYKVDATLDNCLVSKGSADDGLNIKSSRIQMQHCTFSGNASDGFDGDSVTGNIDRCVFDGNGGDALDLSFANLSITHCLLRNSGDKNISVGERSKVDVFNSLLSGGTTGLASKDLSRVKVTSCLFEANKVGIDIYKKKAIFGVGTVEALSTLFMRNSADIKIEKSSHASLSRCAFDGMKVTGTATQVDCIREFRSMPSWKLVGDWALQASSPDDRIGIQDEDKLHELAR